MKNFAVIALLIGTGVVPALADDATFDWSFGNGVNGPYGSGTLEAQSLGNGLYLADSGSGSITDPNGNNYSVTLATVTENEGGVLGGCAAVPSGPALCDTARGVDGTGANYSYDDLIYTGTAQGSGANVDYNGIEFETLPNDEAGNLQFNISTYGLPNTGGVAYCGVGNVYCGGVSGASITPAAATPDGGTTLALLGLAIAGMAGLRSKLSV